MLGEASFSRGCGAYSETGIGNTQQGGGVRRCGGMGPRRSGPSLSMREGYADIEVKL